VNARHKGSRAELAASVWLLDQGYEVFRNISFHGPVDLVAVKSGETLLLDVKCKYPKIYRSLATQEQIDLGVKFLMPVGDSFEIFDIPGPETETPKTHCRVCGKPLGMSRQRYCSQTCTNKYNQLDRLRRANARHVSLP
jgi:predicted nucleic acid-binding Zn ribbon protein